VQKARLDPPAATVAQAGVASVTIARIAAQIEWLGMIRTPHGGILLLWLAFCSLQATSAPAQAVLPAEETASSHLAAGAAPSLPSAPVPVIANKPATEEPHVFWDKTNAWLFAGVGAARALDYASTKNMLARGREEILLPDDIVKNDAGFAALEAAATGASIGVSYIMHRTGHHSIERWVSITHISVTGFGAVRNYCLESKHPAPLPPAP
jgi:hypothetical protein